MDKPFPLQPELIDAVILFANLKLKGATYQTDVRTVFNGAWKVGTLPSLRACRTIQEEVRGWLASDIHGGGDRHALALIGQHRIRFHVVAADGTHEPTQVAELPWTDIGSPALANAEPLKKINLGVDVSRRRFDPGIRLTGTIGYAVENEGPPVVIWSWEIATASLRAICGLAVASICQAGLAGRVGLCARTNCGTYYIDRMSRGTRRIYCKTDDCNKALNRNRVEKNRRKQC